MKLFFAALAVCALALAAQDYPAGQLKHLPIPTASGQPVVTVAALEIERGAEYPTVVHLKGSVEIRMPVCVRHRSREHAGLRRIRGSARR